MTPPTKESVSAWLKNIASALVTAVVFAITWAFSSGQNTGEVRKDICRVEAKADTALAQIAQHRREDFEKQKLDAARNATEELLIEQQKELLRYYREHPPVVSRRYPQ